MLFKSLNILNPIVLDRVWQRAEEIIAIPHSLGQDGVNLLVIGVVIDKVQHIDPIPSLADSFDSSDALFKPGGIPGQIHVNESPEGLQVQTFTCGIRSDNKPVLSITHCVLNVVALNTPPLATQEQS